jgi:hypothetical protein
MSRLAKKAQIQEEFALFSLNLVFRVGRVGTIYFFHVPSLSGTERVWLFGGADSITEEFLDETWELDPVTFTWVRRADMPLALVQAAAAAFEVQGTVGVLLFGGLQSDYTSSGRTFIYRPGGPPPPTTTPTPTVTVTPTITPTPTPKPTPIPVGGVIVPVSRLELSGPWLALVALMVMAAVAVIVGKRTA